MESRISIVTLGVRSLESSFQFYKALGFESSGDPEDGIVFFETNGTSLALYPSAALTHETGTTYKPSISFPGFTLAHVTKSKADVDDILGMIEGLGGRVQKPAEDTFWGGYGGYFSDLDGFYWEVAYADFWAFKPDGHLVLP